MEQKIGFIGVGSMGSALARAAAKTIPARNILLSNRTRSKAETLASELGAVAADNQTIAAEASFIFLGVKPGMLEGLLEGLRPTLMFRPEPFVLVSMAAGVGIERLKQMAGGDYPVIRIMPNTPCAIGEGVVLYTACPAVGEGELQTFLALMGGAGHFAPMSEALFDAGSALSGSGPAYVQMFIEALADGGVACGLPRAVATELAARTLAGSARLLLETGQHPGALKDAVCSPGGTTIQGVRALERGGFRSAAAEAVIAAWEKNRNLI